MNNEKKAIVRATKEEITVYQLQRGGWHDANCIGANQPPTSKTGKKVFTTKELKFRT